MIRPEVLVESRARWKLAIARSEAFHVRVPYREEVRDALLASYRREGFDPPHLVRWIVRLHAEGGLVGTGESVSDPRPHLGRVIGRRVADLADDDSVGPACMIAVYDLAAQTAGVPVARLFSRSPRATIRQAWWSRCFPPDLHRSESRRGLEAGYTVQKLKSRPYEDLVAQIAAVEDGAPPDLELLIDANGTFGSPERALDMARALRRFRAVRAFEEPVPHADLGGYRRLKGELKLRLAVHWEGVDPRLFAAESLCDSFVVEDFHWGPPLAAKAAACDASGQTLWLENGLHSGISQVFQAHTAAALEAVELSISLTHVLEDDLVLEPFTVAHGGWYTVPTTPGLGVTLDQDAVERYRVS